jgi:L-amino acid N-acyltransferase YncA
MSSGFLIRPSDDQDVGAIAAIYRHHVLNGIASFDAEPPDPDEIARRRREILTRGLPYLVAERSGQVLGYCYASPYRARSAYRFSVEDSIYIDQAEFRRGIGSVLLTELIGLCAALGYRQMVAVIGGSEQWPSIGLHQALGFTEVGVLRAIGYKFGGWVDTVLMQRALGEGATTHPFSPGDEHG